MSKWVDCDSWSSADGKHQTQRGCWGAEIKGTSEGCTHGFKRKGAKFKDKFCSTCRGGVMCPLSRIWILSPEESKRCFRGNSLSDGFWSSCLLATVTPDGDKTPIRRAFRVINHSYECSGPHVIVFKNAPHPVDTAVSSLALPSQWAAARDGTNLQLRIKRSTLAPDGKPKPSGAEKTRQCQVSAQLEQSAAPAALVAEPGSYESASMQAECRDAPMLGQQKRRLEGA